MYCIAKILDFQLLLQLSSWRKYVAKAIENQIFTMTLVNLTQFQNF